VNPGLFACSAQDVLRPVGLALTDDEVQGDQEGTLHGEDGDAGGDGDVVPLPGPPFSDPWSGVRSARRKFCAAATSSSGWRRRAEARARHDGLSGQVFGLQSPDPVPEQCQKWCQNLMEPMRLVRRVRVLGFPHVIPWHVTPGRACQRKERGLDKPRLGPSRLTLSPVKPMFVAIPLAAVIMHVFGV
jgi:hypothetical protein